MDKPDVEARRKSRYLEVIHEFALSQVHLDSGWNSLECRQDSDCTAGICIYQNPSPRL